MREISLSDYQVGSDFGNGSENELGELMKALNAGSITGRETTDSTTASGSPLKVESLENTLKVLTFKESDINLWKQIPKLPAYNTVEEYNQLAEYGTDGGGFNNEGELPEEEDSTYVRRAQLVKFMGTTRVISHPMQLINTMIGNVVQQEIKNGTMKILRQANKALAFGDEKLVPQEWNGLYAQHKNAFTSLANYHASEVVIDLRGKSLREKNIEDAALALIENFGEGTLLMAPPKVLSNFVKSFHDSKLIQPNSPQVSAGEMGQKVVKFWSQFGAIDLAYDKFLKSSPGIKSNNPATSPKAPSPVTVGAAPAVVADLTNNFAGFTGDYYYAVTAINRYGESTPTVMAAGLTTVAAGQSVDLDFNDGGGAIPATAYKIYRTEKNPAGSSTAVTYYPIFTISVSELANGYDGGAVTIVRDKNRVIPNTESGFLIEPTTDVWSFKQLAPLMKMDLAQIGPASRFMVLLYGTPMLYAPKKMVKFINIGADLT